MYVSMLTFLATKSGSFCLFHRIYSAHIRVVPLINPAETYHKDFLLPLRCTICVQAPQVFRGQNVGRKLTRKISKKSGINIL
jgi:hypothetical protein